MLLYIQVKIYSLLKFVSRSLNPIFCVSSLKLANKVQEIS